MQTVQSRDPRKRRLERSGGAHSDLPLLALAAVAALAGCAGLKQRRLEREQAEQEAARADATLAGTTEEQALLAIARARDARTGTAALGEMARHAAPSVRAEALRALGLVGDLGALEVLVSGLGDRSPEVRAEAAFALSQIPAWRTTGIERATATAEAEEELVSALEADVQGTPSAAAAALLRALGEVGTEASEDLLWSLLPQEELAPDVLVALALRGRRGVTAPLSADRVGALRAPAPGGGTPSWQLAYLLARAGVAEEAREEAAALIASWLEASDVAPDARAWLLRALGGTRTGTAAEVLGSALRGGSVRDRIAVVRGAAAAGAQGVPILAIALADSEETVAVEAARSLGEAGVEDAWTALAGWGDGADLSPSRLAARLDGMAGFVASPGGAGAHAREARDAATAALGSADPGVRAAAYALLGADPSPDDAAGLLLARVESEGEAVPRLALAGAVAGLSSDAVEGTLLAWLAGPDPMLSAVAAGGLKGREGAHLTLRLAEAYRAARPRDGGPDVEWERRVEVARALSAREGVDHAVEQEMLGDPEPLVRMIAFDAVAARAGRATGREGMQFQARPLPDLLDPWFGAGDVVRATIRTSRGEMVVSLLPRIAPAAVSTFASLAEQGFYDGLVFHRVVPDFVIQAGDPQGTGWGGPGFAIRDEYSRLPFVRGTMGMARSDKDTAGSQWFVTHSPQPHLDGHYTAFGQLVSGWDVLDAIRQGDAITSIAIERRKR